MFIEVKNLNYLYNSNKVLNNINFTLQPNECLVVQGHNGGGKTTLINCLVRDNKVSNNKIFYDGVDINNFNDWTKLGYVPQTIDYAKFPISVLEFLKAYEKRNDTKRVLNLLEEFELIHIKNKNLHSLSGGQKRRVFIIRALLNNCKLLIFDEPLVAIDKENRIKIIEILKKLKNEGISMIIITHNFIHFSEITDKIMALNNDVEFYGTKDEFTKYFEVSKDGIS